MRNHTLVHLFASIVFLSACIAKPASAPNNATPNPLTVSVTSANLTQLVLPTASPIPTSTPTSTLVAQPAFENIKWATYGFDVGVTFEYPSDWITDSNDTDRVLLSGYESQVRVEVYNRPLEDRAVADPHSWGPNEAGYKILWEKPISIENAAGLEFIWGRRRDDGSTRYLSAIFYSAQYELDVRLKMEIDTLPPPVDKFRVFEHMVQSVRIGP